MHMPLMRIIAELPSLTKQDRALIRAAIDKLDDGNTAPGPLFDVLKKLSGSNVVFSSFRRMRHYKTWIKSEEQIMLFITKGWPDANKVALNSLKHFMFSILADDLKKRKIPVTVNTLILNSSRIPALFELSFPNYLKAGLGHVVLMHLVGRNGKSS